MLKTLSLAFSVNRRGVGLWLAILICALLTTTASADEISDVQKQINRRNSEYSSAQASLAKIKNDLASLGSSLSGTQAQLDEANLKVADARKQLSSIETTLDEKQKTLGYLIDIRNKQIRAIYTHPHLTGLELIISTESLATLPEFTTYQRKVAVDAQGLVRIVNDEVTSFQKTKEEMVSVKNELEAAAAEISNRLASLQGQYSTTASQQYSVSNQIGQISRNLKSLSSRQKKLIEAKLAATSQNTTVGSAAPASTSLPAPGFSPAYAVATYGYPHRVGMNQYGAYGRALVGQNYVQILKAYYAGVGVGKKSLPSTIKVSGYGTLSFENNYLRGISEMPRSWPLEALKAQAVAARTYAWKWMLDHPGGSICTTQSCQVYRGQSDLINCSGTYNARWCQAVNETKGVVITYGGSPITAWYSSTTGGYTLTSAQVWGGYTPYTKNMADGAGSWPANAYDGPKYGKSPWFHKPWGSSVCGGNTPWLTKAQMADIFNALLLSKANSTYNQYLSPPDGCLGPAGWSFQRVKDQLKKLGIKDAGDVGKFYTGFDGKGNSSVVSIVSSNYGALVYNAADFRSIFALRSPGTLVIQTSLFDAIECPPTCK